MNETKKPLNFCVCVIEADNKGKKKISIICSSYAQNQNIKMKLCRKIKTSGVLFDFDPFLFC